MKLYLRSCSRCIIGAVQLTEDLYGEYLYCINCGFTIDKFKKTIVVEDKLKRNSTIIYRNYYGAKT